MAAPGHQWGCVGGQGDGSASVFYHRDLPNDTWHIPSMSYFSDPNYSGSSYRYVVTPQMADIYAPTRSTGAADLDANRRPAMASTAMAGAVFQLRQLTSGRR